MATETGDAIPTTETQAAQIPWWVAVAQANDMTAEEKLPHLAATCRHYGDILNYVAVALERGDINAATACLRNPYACLGEYAPMTDDCSAEGVAR